MPCYKCSNGKYRLGSGPCMYKSKEKCEKAYAAYRAQKMKELEERRQITYEL